MTPVTGKVVGQSIVLPVYFSVGETYVMTVPVYNQEQITTFTDLSNTSYPASLGQKGILSPGYVSPYNSFYFTFSGTEVTVIPVNPVSGNSPSGALGLSNYVIAGGFSGLPTAGMVLITAPAVLQYTLPLGLSGSSAVAGVAPTNSSSLSILKNGVNIGLISFNSGSTVGTFSMAVQTTLSSGDVLVISAPGVVDPTFANVGFSLLGLLN